MLDQRSDGNFSGRAAWGRAREQVAGLRYPPWMSALSIRASSLFSWLWCRSQPAGSKAGRREQVKRLHYTALLHT
jgi:hypothetical protein